MVWPVPWKSSNRLTTMKSTLLLVLMERSLMMSLLLGNPTALNTVGNAIEYELSAMVKNKKTHMRSQKAQKDTQVIQDWVGSEVYEEMVCKAFQGLLYINEHRDDDVCLEQVDTFPGKPVPDHYCLPQHLSWSLWWMGAY